MEIIIKFNTDNAAFEDDFEGEIMRLLEQSQRFCFGLGKAEAGCINAIKRLRDVNGNTVGTIHAQQDEA